MNLTKLRSHFKRGKRQKVIKGASLLTKRLISEHLRLKIVQNLTSLNQDAYKKINVNQKQPAMHSKKKLLSGL